MTIRISKYGSGDLMGAVQKIFECQGEPREKYQNTIQLIGFCFCAGIGLLLTSDDKNNFMDFGLALWAFNDGTRIARRSLYVMKPGGETYCH